MNEKQFDSLMQELKNITRCIVDVEIAINKLQKKQKNPNYICQNCNLHMSLFEYNSGRCPSCNRVIKN